MKVEGVPWMLLLTLFWVGLIGWGLKPKERFQINWRHTLFFLAFLPLFSFSFSFFVVMRALLLRAALCDGG